MRQLLRPRRICSNLESSRSRPHQLTIHTPGRCLRLIELPHPGKSRSFMILTRRRGVLGALFTTSLAATLRPAGAVIVLDSTWRAEGGGPGQESRGFRAHVALANQPQFAGLIPLSHAGDDNWGAGSGTWIGNFGGFGHVLTAAHVFDRGGSAADHDYRIPDAE